MKRTYIKNLTEGECCIKGYVETIRDKKIMFLVIRDVTGAVQVTIVKDECPEVTKWLKNSLRTASFPLRASAYFQNT